MTLERVESIEEVRTALARPRLEGRTIGLVTTMGALHDGHLSLVRASRARADVTVVSIFVNPTQFGPNEDLDAYPRDLPGDLALLDAEGVDLVFTPSADAMYPPGAVTRVDPGPIGTVWCGASRPGHFVGVATVVTKLLDIVRPDIAFFGEKDFQQLKVIERVVRDLDIPVRIVGCPIVRQHDGLALSSRNAYLSADDRAHALVLSRALGHAREAAAAGETDAAELTRSVAAEVAAEPGVEIDYAAIVDSETLVCVTRVQRSVRVLVAARVGGVRLIDNVAMEPPKA
jgi:pantoate--beta-alanine ligase